MSVALYPAYVRGEACLMARQGSAAVAEFEKILDHPGLAWYSPLGSLAHVALAWARAVAGDKAGRAPLIRTSSLSGDADPGVPILKRAKAE